MSAIEALNMNLGVKAKVTAAVNEALKLGMTCEEVLAILNNIVSVIEASDGDE